MHQFSCAYVRKTVRLIIGVSMTNKSNRKNCILAFLEHLSTVNKRTLLEFIVCHVDHNFTQINLRYTDVITGRKS